MSTNYSVIMDDGYGDIRIFYINNYNEKTQKSIKLLFKNHIILAVVPRSGGYINSRGGWSMNRGDMMDQIYLSEFVYDTEEGWKQYKAEMKSFIEDCVVD